MSGIRPMSVGELIDGAFQVTKRRLIPLVKIAAIVVVPTQLLTILIQISARPTTERITQPFGTADQFQVTRTVTDFKVFIAAFIAVAILGLLARTIAAGAMVHIVGGDYLGTEIDPSAALREAMRRIPGLIGAGILVSLASGIGLLFCVVPGVFLYVSWSVTTPALIIERASATTAMSRSMQLVKPRWWPTLGFGALLWLIAAIPGFVIAIPVAVAMDSNSVGGIVVTGLLGMAVSLFVTPFTSAATVLLYFDLRVRNEGFDMHMLASSIDAAPPAGGWPTNPVAPGGLAASGPSTSDAQPWGAQPGSTQAWGAPPPPPVLGQNHDDVPPPPPFTPPS